MSAQNTDHQWGGSKAPHVGTARFLWIVPKETPLENLSELHDLWEDGVDVTSHPLTRGEQQ